MKQDFFKKILNTYHSVKQSIAFVPTAFSILFILLAVFLIDLQETQLTQLLTQLFPWLKMRSADHATQVLTTLLSGMITLTVFSFSVVMIILNQAASNFIPKILYKLTEDKFMQIVLGCYIGTIVYYIILLVDLGKEDGEFFMPELAFILGIVFAIGNMFLFVYFIHRTTISIHAKKLSKRLFHDTKQKLHKEKIKYFINEETKWINKETNWYHFYSTSNGYLQTVEDDLINLLSEKELIMRIEPVLGDYIIEKMLLFSLNRRVEESLVREIESGLIFYDEDRIGENSKHGFSQITEIAIKSLSSGLNDPGTAIFCSEYLTQLLCLRIKQTGDIHKRDKKDAIRIIIKNETFDQVLFSSFNSIRNYGKADVKVMETLVKGLAKISLHDKDELYINVLNDHLQAIIETGDQNFLTQLDKNHFKQTITEACKGSYFLKTFLLNDLT